ncbi:MAG: PKD domain-containing protein [Bacillota bacterium]
MLLFGVSWAVRPSLDFCRAGASHEAPVKVDPSPVPVLLISGLPPGTNTWNAGQPVGMWNALLKCGYQPEVSLFTLDYTETGDPDYTVLYRTKLMAKLEQIKQTTGSDVVDVIAHSYGGLVARYYVQSPEYRRDIRNLVLIATPNHGCTPLQKIKTTMILLQHCSRYLQASVDPATNLDELIPFTEELEYVARRAPAYREAYAEFVLTARLLWVPGPNSSKPKEFEEWLKSSFPEQFALTLGNKEPPWGPPQPAPDGHYNCSPRAGNELSLSYYEHVASLAGKHQYISERAKQKVLNELLNQTIASSSLKEAALKAGKVLLIYFAGRLIEPAKAALEAKVLEAALLKAGIPPTGATLNRLLEEEVFIPGTDISIGVNYFLRAWNTAEEESRKATRHWPRYIMIAGNSPSPWKFLGFDGTNDLVVSVDSARLEPALDDHICLISSGISSSHLMIQNSEKAVQLIIDLLREPFPTAQSYTPYFRQGIWKRWSWSQKGEVLLSNYRPSYLGIDLHNLETDVALRFKGDPNNVAVWAYAKGPSSHWEPLDLIHSQDHWELRLPGCRYEKVVVGLRLKGPLDKELRKAFSYELTLQVSKEEAIPSNAQQPNADQEHVAQVTESKPPRVNVVYRSKQTTHLDDHSSYHHKWVWDFGDGSPQLEVNGDQNLKDYRKHTFPGPGSYLVTATSVDSQGKALKRQQWHVEIGSQDQLEAEFQAETFIPPDIDLKLVGPEMWITGRPATFSVELDCETPEGAELQVVSVDPGRKFEVQWERPGTFQVKAAVTVRTTYRDGEHKVSVVQTKVITKQVKVVTLAISQ